MRISADNGQFESDPTALRTDQWIDRWYSCAEITHLPESKAKMLGRKSRAESSSRRRTGEKSKDKSELEARGPELDKGGRGSWVATPFIIEQKGRRMLRAKGLVCALLFFSPQFVIQSFKDTVPFGTLSVSLPWDLQAKRNGQ